MTTPKFPNSEAYTPEFLSSNEGTVMDNETYVDILRNETLRSPEEGRALGEASLLAMPIDDIHSHERAQIARLHKEQSMETKSFKDLSDQALSARILQIRKEMLKGTRKDFDLAA